LHNKNSDSINGSEETMSAIARNVRYGERLRAYPTCFNHAQLPSILGIIRRNPIYRDIVLGGSECSSSRFALRVKAFLYPEGTMALWCMIASCVSQ
jgi:hypothetical protein